MKYLMVRNMTYDEWYFDKGVVAIGWGDINFSKYNDADSLIEKRSEERRVGKECRSRW